MLNNEIKLLCRSQRAWKAHYCAGHYFRDSSVMCSSPLFFCDNFMFVSKTLYEVEFWMEGSSHKLNTHGFDPITCIACSSTTYCIARLSLIDVLCQSFRVNLCLESFLTYRTSRYISRNKPRIFNSIMLKQD